MKSQGNTIAGLYCRLSREDSHGDSLSMSIENQKHLLMEYARERGWDVFQVYVDDGYTGTNFDRPAFKQMVKDAEAGRINCIITKDLSRLGRNYTEAGRYTEETFPRLGVRFIAINDSVDSDVENDFAAFHHVINEFYPRQVSKKVKQVKAAGARQGKFMGSHPPYGYVRSPENKHLLVIEEESAMIVRGIFTSFAGGDSGRMIADRLNNAGVDSPRFHYYSRQGKTNPKASETNVWNSCTLMQLLRNQVYLGHLAQGKRRVVSFKTKERQVVDPDDWIVVKDTHEPIISQELWDRVHQRLARRERVRITKKNTVGLFSGKIFCATCGGHLAYMHKATKDEEKGVYRCSRYNNGGKSACTAHYIDERFLSAFVLNDVNLYAKLAVADQEQLSKQLLREMTAQQNAESSALRSQAVGIENKLSAIDARLKDLYVDKCDGKIPEQTAFTLMNGFVEEQDQLKEKLTLLKAQIDTVQSIEGDIGKWMVLIQQQLDIQELDRVTVAELIDRVMVSETRDENGKRMMEVSIEYRFIGNLLDNNKEGIA